MDANKYPLGVFDDDHPPAYVRDALMEKSNAMERPLTINETAEIAFTVASYDTVQHALQYDDNELRDYLEDIFNKLKRIRRQFEY